MAATELDHVPVSHAGRHPLRIIIADGTMHLYEENGRRAREILRTPVTSWSRDPTRKSWTILTPDGELHVEMSSECACGSPLRKLTADQLLALDLTPV